MPETWTMWARLIEGEFWYFGASEFKASIATKRGELAQVRLTEDPEGTYFGWLAAKDGVFADYPSHTQFSYRRFILQGLSDSIDNLQAAGKGRLVQMRAEAL